MSARRVELDGLHNFRDLGGYPTTDGRRVREARVYRSDALHRMSAADVARVRDLGIASVIDLRAPDEIAHVGTGRIDELGARYRNLPTRPAIFADPAEIDADRAAAMAVSAPERYFGYLGEGPACFAGVVEVLADPTAAPVVFFCNAGKDRTGVTAAMVLGVLGVDDELVAADYARTQDALDAIHSVTRREYPVDVKAWRALSPDMRDARAETMLAFLHLVRERLGGWEEYLGSVGVERPTTDAVRDALLESPPPP